MNYDDEIVMAYVDGELDPTRRAEIDAAIASDPALARRVEQQRALRRKLAGAFDPVREQPVPDRLMAAARGAGAASTPQSGKVLKFPARATHIPSAPWRTREWTAMAASLLVGVLLSWRFFGTSGSSPMVASADGLRARGELAAALDRQLASEQTGDEPVLIGLTFKAHDGNYCRSFVMGSTRTAGLACRAGKEWQIPVSESVTVSGGGLQQAGSALSPSILKIIEARMEGAALDAEGEKAAQAGAWQAGP
jgi:hypothetical protein